MEVYECVRSRVTVRSIKPDPVPDAVVRKLLRAGRWAPSSRNRQPWHFIVVSDAQMLKRLGEIATSGRFIADAPLAIAIVVDDADRPELDAGRALQQMELVAWDEGLGTCFVGLRVEEQNWQIKELLGMPIGEAENSRRFKGNASLTSDEDAHDSSDGDGTEGREGAAEFVSVA